MRSKLNQYYQTAIEYSQSANYSSDIHTANPTQMTDKVSKRKRASMLTDDQKKKHHIESEHKRRQAIRDAFVKLVDIVPQLEPADSRSEIVVLTKSAEYLSQLYQDHLDLLHRLESKNINIDEKLKLGYVPKDSFVYPGSDEEDESSS